MNSACHYSVLANSNNNAGDNFLYPLMRELIDNLSSNSYRWTVKDQWSVTSCSDINNEPSDRALFGGGGLILPDQKGASFKNQTFWQLDIPANDYYAINKPYFGAAIGFNWFKYCSVSILSAKKSITAFAENSQFFGLRNQGSIKSLSALIENKKILSWLPCPSTLIKICSLENLCKETLAGLTFNSQDKKKIGVNVALDRLEQRGLSLLDIISVSFLV